jgi:hypothetical protein
LPEIEVLPNDDNSNDSPDDNNDDSPDDNM